jgi:hypothetical protein
MIITDAIPLVAAIAIVETDNRVVTGDGGRALSAYQIHEAFWLDCVQYLRHRPELRLNIGNSWADIGGTDPFSQARAKDTCTAGVLMISDYLIAHAIKDTPENIYAAYTIGRAGLKACEFNIHHEKFPAFKRGKCDRIARLVQAAETHTHD